MGSDDGDLSYALEGRSGGVGSVHNGTIPVLYPIAIALLMHGNIPLHPRGEAKVIFALLSVFNLHLYEIGTLKWSLIATQDECQWQVPRFQGLFFRGDDQQIPINRGRLLLARLDKLPGIKFPEHDGIVTRGYSEELAIRRESQCCVLVEKPIQSAATGPRRRIPQPDSLVVRP